jgi:proteic killer suppression protein
LKIERIRHKGLRRLYDEDDASGLPAASAGKIRNILAALEFAADLSDLRGLPGWRLHPLQGERRGCYAITVTGNWRITFRLSAGSVTDLDFEDYH